MISECAGTSSSLSLHRGVRQFANSVLPPRSKPAKAYSESESGTGVTAPSVVAGSAPSAGFDVADDHIVSLVEKDDLVITADIPLAAEVIEKQGKALNPRGELYTASNIRARLNMRDFMDSMRSSGVEVGGGPP